MNWTATIVLFQWLLSLPPLGFVKTALGVQHLYGMRANFVLGEPLHDVQSAYRLHGIEVLRRPGEIRIIHEGEHHVTAADGPAFFAIDTELEAVYAWFPNSGEMLRWRDGEVHRTFIETPGGETIAFAFAQPNRLEVFTTDTQSSYDARSLQLIEHSAIAPVDALATDTKGNRWTATQSKVMCGARRWTTDTPVIRLSPLDAGWMLITTADRNWAARCESEELAAVPQPELQQ